MKKLIKLILIIVCLSSCSAERRLANLLAKHPELVKVDTVYAIDTIVIEAKSVDSMFFYNQTDTVIIQEGGVIIKYFYNTKDSTVYLKGTCDTITIIKRYPVEVLSVEVKPETWGEKAWRITKDIALMLILGALLMLIFMFRRKIFNRNG